MPWKDPNITLEVTNKIFKYLTWKRVNKFKEVSTTAKTYIEQNKVDLCFKSTMECLNEETTKQINGKKNKNKKMFKLKNRMKFRVTGMGEWKMGYIVKRLRQRMCLLSLGMKSSPAFVLGEQMEDVQNWVWIKIRNGELGGEH